MSEDHIHVVVPLPPVNPGLVNETDMSVFGALVGAANEGCRPCQTTLVATVVNGDPSVVAHAVALAWLMESSATMRLTGQSRPVDSLPVTIQPIVRAIRASTDADSSTWEKIAASMSPAEREEALDYALDTIVGMQAMSAIGPFFEEH